MTPESRQPRIDARLTLGRGTGRRPKRSRHEVETLDYLAGARRFLKAAGVRVGQGDEAELGSLLGLQQSLDAAVQVAVGGQLAMGKTWRDIAAATGKTPQAAHKRWGRKTDTTTPGSETTA